MKEAIEKTVLHARPIEVRQAQHGTTDLSCRVGFEQEVFLLLAHPALEGMRLARMIFAGRRRLCTAVRIYSTYQQHLLEPFRHRSVERLTHQNRMQLEVVVRNAYQVDRRVSTAQSCFYRGGIIRVPNGNLSQRIGAEGAVERCAITANGTIALTTFAQLGCDAFANCTRCTQQDQFHRYCTCPCGRKRRISSAQATALVAPSFRLSAAAHSQKRLRGCGLVLRGTHSHQHLFLARCGEVGRCILVAL